MPAPWWPRPDCRPEPAPRRPTARAAAAGAPARRPAGLRTLFCGALPFYIAWLAALLLAAPAAQAQPAPPQAACQPPTPEALQRLGPTAALQLLQDGLPRCQREPAWLALLGHLLVGQQQYAAAADHLERALMLEPDQTEARIDYTLALAGLGDTASARALAASLLADPALPDALRPALQRQLALWAQPPEAPSAALAGWQASGALGLRAGLDTNLLGAPRLDSLTLTVGGQTQPLPLSDDYRARAGNDLRAEAQLQLARAWPDGVRWDLAASLRDRSSPAVAQAGYQQLDLLAERTRNPVPAPGPAAPLAGLGSYLTLAASAYHADNASRYTTLALAGGLQQGLAAGCQGRAGLELQQRLYPADTLLSGHYQGAALALACEAPAQPQWLLAARLGRDRAADPLRAGGDQWQLSLRAAHQRPMPWPAGLALADAELALSRDERGYSPLLDNGRVRTLQRAALRLELQRRLGPAAPAGGGWQASLGAEWVDQQSSLALFGLQSWGPYARLRWRW